MDKFTEVLVLMHIKSLINTSLIIHITFTSYVLASSVSGNVICHLGRVLIFYEAPDNNNSTDISYENQIMQQPLEIDG